MNQLELERGVKTSQIGLAWSKSTMTTPENFNRDDQDESTTTNMLITAAQHSCERSHSKIQT